MESKLARQLEEEQLAAEQRLSAEERLEAFLAHSRLMTELHAAAERTPSVAGPAKPTGA